MLTEIAKAAYLVVQYEEYAKIDKWLRGQRGTRRQFYKTMKRQFPNSWSWL